MHVSPCQFYPCLSRRQRSFAAFVMYAFVCISTFQSSAAIKLLVKSQQEECVSHTIDLEQSQFARDNIVTVDAGLQVLAPNGAPNNVKRRMIDVSVYSPSGRVIYKKGGVFQDVQVSAPAKEMGTFKLCMSAVGPHRLDAKVNVIYFTVNRDDSAAKDGLQTDPSGPKDELASHVHLTQVQNLITRVSGQLDRVRGEQRYFRARLQRHMVTNETIHKRAFLYFAVEACVILLLAGVQVLTVHLMFRSRRATKTFVGIA